MMSSGKRKERARDAKRTRDASPGKRKSRVQSKRGGGGSGLTPRTKIAACAAVFLLCLAFALLVGDADYHASAIGWMPVFILIIAIILARAYLSALKRGLVFEDVPESRSCRRGEVVGFKARFKNKTPLFYFRIKVSFFISDLDGNVASEMSTTIALAPFEEYLLDFNVGFDHVGTYRAGVDKVEITDFMRLFTARMRNANRSEIQVTPRIQPLESVGLVSDSHIEATRPSKSVFSDSGDYASVREYVPGDPLKTIHWKLSARQETYLTRLYERATNPGVAVLIDFYTPESRPEKLMGMFDALVETAFSVGRLAQASGFETEIRYRSKLGVPERRVTWSEDELADIVRDMPNLGNDRAREFDCVSELSAQVNAPHGQNNLVLCTGNLSADTVSLLQSARMRKRNPILFAVVPDDLEGRELDEWCSSLAALDASGIRYRVLRRSDELTGMKA